MKPGESASADGIELDDGDEDAAKRKGFLRDDETFSICTGCFLGSDVHSSPFSPDLPRICCDGSGVTDNFLDSSSASRTTSNRHEIKKLDQMLTGHPRPSPALAPLCCGSMDGEARPALVQESCRAGKHSETNLSSNPDWDHPRRTPGATWRAKDRGNWNSWGFSGMDSPLPWKRRVSDWSSASECGLCVWSKPPEPHGNGSPRPVLGSSQAHPHGVWLDLAGEDPVGWESMGL